MSVFIPEEGHAIAVAGLDVSVEGIVADVGLAPCENEEGEAGLQKK